MTREEVLALLSQGDYVSGQKMSQQLGVSRAAVWKAIDRLRAEGYTIESATNRGYRLTGVPNRLSLTGVQRALGKHPWLDQVEVLDTVAPISARLIANMASMKFETTRIQELLQGLEKQVNAR